MVVAALAVAADSSATAAMWSISFRFIAFLRLFLNEAASRHVILVDDVFRITIAGVGNVCINSNCACRIVVTHAADGDMGFQAKAVNPRAVAMAVVGAGRSVQTGAIAAAAVAPAIAVVGRIRIQAKGAISSAP